MLINSRLSYLRPLSTTHTYEGLTRLPLLWVIRGHMRSNALLPLIFEGIETEQCAWSQCVSLAETHRLICNMTYLGRNVTSSDLDLRSN